MTSSPYIDLAVKGDLVAVMRNLRQHKPVDKLSVLVAYAANDTDMLRAFLMAGADDEPLDATIAVGMHQPDDTRALVEQWRADKAWVDALDERTRFTYAGTFERQQAFVADGEPPLFGTFYWSPDVLSDRNRYDVDNADERNALLCPDGVLRAPCDRVWMIVRRRCAPNLRLLKLADDDNVTVERQALLMARRGVFGYVSTKYNIVYLFPVPAGQRELPLGGSLFVETMTTAAIVDAITDQADVGDAADDDDVRGAVQAVVEAIGCTLTDDDESWLQERVRSLWLKKAADDPRQRSLNDYFGNRTSVFKSHADAAADLLARLSLNSQ